MQSNHHNVQAHMMQHRLSVNSYAGQETADLTTEEITESLGGELTPFQQPRRGQQSNYDNYRNDLSAS